MKIKEKFRMMTGAEIWDILVCHVQENRSFSSITGISYSATFVGSCIFIKGGKAGTKRSGEGEYFTGKDFIKAYDIVRSFPEINTSTVKPYIKRQQTPFIGLLYSAGIIE